MVDLIAFIKTAGYLGLFAVIFTESGLFFGFFLPGDSVLFAAGFLASQGFLNLFILTAVVFTAAILGVNVGYAFGLRVGPKIFNKEESVLFNREHLERTKIFYEKYGAKTIVLARFLPVIRTFAPILAGVGKMDYPTFVFYNILGAVIWAIGMPLAGYFLGNAVPGIDRYIIPIVILIIIVSFLPTAIHIFRHKEERTRILAFLRAKLLGRRDFSHDQETGDKKEDQRK